MVAVPEARVPAALAGFADGRCTLPARHRRIVAVAVSSMELLRPGSDLARLLEDAGPADLLLACDDGLACAPGPVRVANPAAHLDDDPDDEDLDDRSPEHEVRAGADALGLTDVALHRLGLCPPLGHRHEDDLVAALSELVGFDPEPGLYCLAPAAVPSNPSQVVVVRAAQRIAQVYGVPLLRYRCLELSAVG